jgi:hypothetical protein
MTFHERELYQSAVLNAALGKGLDVPPANYQQYLPDPVPEFRKAGDWRAERPFITLYNGHGEIFERLMQAYGRNDLTILDILAILPPEIRWLQQAIVNMHRCRNQEVLLILGQCPLQDRSDNLNATVKDLPFTK